MFNIQLPIVFNNLEYLPIQVGIDSLTVTKFNKHKNDPK